MPRSERGLRTVLFVVVVIVIIVIMKNPAEAGNRKLKLIRLLTSVGHPRCCREQFLPLGTIVSSLSGFVRAIGADVVCDLREGQMLHVVGVDKSLLCKLIPLKSGIVHQWRFDIAWYMRLQ